MLRVDRLSLLFAFVFELATLLAERLRKADGVAAVDVAGPGFLNVTVSAGARVAHVIAALEQGRAVYVDLSAVPEASRSGARDEHAGTRSLVFFAEWGHVRLFSPFAMNHSPLAAARCQTQRLFGRTVYGKSSAGGAGRASGGGGGSS